MAEPIQKGNETFYPLDPPLPMDDPNFDVDQVRKHWEAKANAANARLTELEAEMNRVTRELQEAEQRLMEIEFRTQ